MDGARRIAVALRHDHAETTERERGARPPVCQYCAAIADTAGPGLPLGWTIQSGVRGWTYLCATCTRSNLRSIESRLFDRDALGFGTAN